MQVPRHFSGLAAAWLVALVGFTGKVVGQVPDSVRLPEGVVIGHVTDTTGSPVPEAEIAVTRESDSLVVTLGRTDSKGVARLPRVPSGGPYTVLARKVGYQPVYTPGLRVREGDTLKVSFVLRPHILALPEVAATAKPRGWQGLFGIGLFKCVFGGADGEASQMARARAAGCTQNFDAHTARRMAREAAEEVQGIMRRVEKAIRAGRRPDPNYALIVLNTTRMCNREIPKRPPWPRPDPDVDCREIFKRIPRETLGRLGKVLAAIEASESFEEELHRLEAEKRHRQEEELRQRGEAWRRILDSLQDSAKSPDR